MNRKKNTNLEKNVIEQFKEMYEKKNLVTGHFHQQSVLVYLAHYAVV